MIMSFHHFQVVINLLISSGSVIPPCNDALVSKLYHTIFGSSCLYYQTVTTLLNAPCSTEHFFIRELSPRILCLPFKHLLRNNKTYFSFSMMLDASAGWSLKFDRICSFPHPFVADVFSILIKHIYRKSWMCKVV